MSDRGMIFSEWSIRQLLAGHKTQTRRVLSTGHLRLFDPDRGLYRPSKQRFAASLIDATDFRLIQPDSLVWTGKAFDYQNAERTHWQGAIVPAVGDRLWVREALGFWSTGYDCEISYCDGATLHAGPASGHVPEGPPLVSYFRNVDKADGHKVPIRSRHMPRWASRLTLIIESVKVEQVQSISEADAIAEGVERVADDYGRGYAWKSYETCRDGKPHPHSAVPNRSPITSYREMWESLHRGKGERWSDNPWVIAFNFRVERGNIDRLAA